MARRRSARWPTERKRFRSVDKIVGPGNEYVQAAKRMVYGTVDIDMIAGPSEVAIVADETCDPAWIAADLLAQAEHDEMAGVWLVCWSEGLAAAVFDEVQVQLESLERKAIARVAIDEQRNHFYCRERGRGHRTRESHRARTRRGADGGTRSRRRQHPKCRRSFHRTLCADCCRRLLCGTEPRAADGRTARFFSPLGVPDFMKRTSVIRYSGRAIERFGEMIENFADAEGLTGHARSITIRRHQA